MGLNLPLKMQVLITLSDPRTLKCEADVSSVPSLNLAIAMVEDVLRQLKNEETNRAAVLFGNRLMREQQEAAVAQAVASGRKQ